MMKLWKGLDGFVEIQTPFVHRDKAFIIFYSTACCSQFTRDGHRLWIAVGKRTAQQIKATSPAVLKGYFDGSFLNFNRFPTDASIYLFLWDPQSKEEQGVDIPIE